ncbi:MAG: PecA family PE domain-processing aspartic protease, partial [Mycobacterium sp.]
LTIVGGTEPVVNASVNGGTPVPLLVDTGSTGLVLPFQNVGGLLGVLQLGLPTGFGFGGYSGGLDYLYATYNAPVNFGGGLLTARTPVNVELFAFPTSIQSAMNNGFTFQSFFAQDGVSGVLGVGPNAGGPGPSIPLQALPSPYNQGLLINEAAASPYLQFGPAPTNLGTPLAILTGAPITTLDVQVGNGGPIQAISSIVDSGGVQGTIPFNAPVGSTISVYAPGTNGKLLYSYTLDGGPADTAYFPVASSGLMNTGALPFLQHPDFIDYGTGDQTFYGT